MKSLKFLKRKPKGQALLVVLVISTLTMIILLGISSRVISSQANIRRTGEYERSLASGENVLNEIITLMDSPSNQSCLTNISQTEFTQMNCPALASVLATNNVAIFAKTGANKLVDITNLQSANLLISQDFNANDISTTGTWITCQNRIGKVLVSRIYYDTVTRTYKNDKGIFDCLTSPAVGTSPSTLAGNVALYDSFGVRSDGVARNKTLLVRARLMDGATPGQVSLEAIGDTNGDNIPDVIASSGRYDFVLVGVGGLGSDSALKFSAQKGNATLPPAFDFVFFGDNN